MPRVLIAVKQRKIDIMQGIVYGIARKILPGSYFNAGLPCIFMAICQKIDRAYKDFFEMKNRN